MSAKGAKQLLGKKLVPVKRNFFSVFPDRDQLATAGKIGNSKATLDSYIYHLGVYSTKSYRNNVAHLKYCSLSLTTYSGW